MKKILIAPIILLLMFSLTACGKDKEVTEEEAKKVIGDMVKVPQTEGKMQEEVEALYEAAGLKIEFVVANMDDRALSQKTVIKKGECDARDESQPGITYFDSDKVGDLYGYYAEKGATIIVGYSDHDFDGTSGKAGETEEAVEEATEGVPEEATETPAETAEADDASSASEIPADLAAQLEDLDARYDSLIDQTKGFIANADSLTITAYTQYMTDYTTLVADFADVSEKIDGLSDDISEDVYLDIWLAIMDKNTELLVEIEKMPEVQ